MKLFSSIMLAALFAGCATAPQHSTEVQDALGPYVERGEIAGVISVLSDKDYNETWDVFGYADVENGRKMSPKTMFACFSMTKTFTGAALMCAIDDGLISLDDEVAKFLPEFEHVKFADGRKPKRAITIRDITSHVDGMTKELPLVDCAVSPRAAAAWYAGQPLACEPGTRFRYGTQRFSVAAACIEVATGKEYYSYLKERVLDPLGMVDTTYSPNDEQISRMVKAYTTKGGKFEPAADRCNNQLKFPKARELKPCGGSGLFSTAADMIRFSQMLAHHGEYKGKTIISRSTFDNIFACLQVPEQFAKSQPYCVGSWLYGDWFGHEGAMRTDQRANLKTGDSRVFFIQTENAAGKAFRDAKMAWHKACDTYQRSLEPIRDELVRSVECGVHGVPALPRNGTCGSAGTLCTQNYDVAAYIWPAYQNEPRWKELGIFDAGKGEWQNVWEAVPKWKGHRQPLKPLWGYEDEADPKVVEKKIEAAVSHGVNTFIYDWYWYGGRPFLENGINKGFLGAKNNEKMKFFIMWANHHVNRLWNNKVADKQVSNPIWRAWVSESEFKTLVARWINQYFKRPNYYRIDGKPVLMIYELKTFIKGVGGREAAKRSLDYLRSECVKAGLGGAHVMICDYGVTAEVTEGLGIDSATIYNLIHWSHLKGNEDYATWAERGQQRFDKARETMGVRDYFAHASVGWDTNPRFPAGSVQNSAIDSTPAKFEVTLRRAKAWADANTRQGAPKLITVNSWNEWTEGSYLEPDTELKFGYLEAIQRVFK